jgi:peptidoglycan hydrolase FlgJ
MSEIARTGGAAQTALAAKEARLRTAAKQLEGVFVEQLFKAMRATVPEDGITSGGSGEEMFTGMLDEHLAALTPSEWRGGLGEALYRQMRSRLPGAAAHAAPTQTSGKVSR